MKFLQISCSGEGGFSVGIAENGSGWSWGGNRYGQLGLGHDDDCNTPQQITFFIEKEILVQIEAGEEHAGALSSLKLRKFIIHRIWQCLHLGKKQKWTIRNWT
jgi:alpha-tubulin suppressor-like RCC1 family protein